MTLRETIARALRAMAPPETKSSRTAQLVHFESGGRARWTPRDYGALAREGFLKNAIVHRSVKLVAENVAAASLILYDGPHPLDAHPLLNLLARPNPREDRAGFLEAVAADLLIAGNAYIEAVSAAGEESASVRELLRCGPTA
jgi:phage portal protein BeeE